MSIYYLAPNIIFSIHIKTAKMIYRIFEGIPTLGHIFRSIIGSIYVEGIQVISNRRKRWPNGIWDPISHMLWQNEKKTFLLKSRKYRAFALIWYPSSTMAKSSLDWNFLNQSKYQGTTVLQLLFDTVLYHSEGNK